MELFDLYDKSRRLTGQTMVRGCKVPEGLYRLVVHICIFNSKGEMLIQQRQPFKPAWSGMWDLSVGGGVTAGESSQTGAHRELKEELGLDMDFSEAIPAVSVAFPDGFDDYYIVEQDVRPGDLSLQYEEVKAVRWAGIEEIFAMIDSGEFIPYHKSFIEFLFFRRTGSGTRDAGSKSV